VANDLVELDALQKQRCWLQRNELGLGDTPKKSKQKTLHLGVDLHLLVIVESTSLGTSTEIWFEGAKSCSETAIHL
jgi:stress response protein SCP2